MNSDKKPLRMCVACRTMQEKKNLRRIVKNNAGEIFFDKTFKANGRGAYICNKKECIDKCKKYRLFNKTFCCEIPNEIYEQLFAD